MLLTCSVSFDGSLPYVINCSLLGCPSTLDLVVVGGDMAAMMYSRVSQLGWLLPGRSQVKVEEAAMIFGVRLQAAKSVRRNVDSGSSWVAAA